MALKIKAMSGATDKDKLNEEWMLLENDSDRPFNMAGCSITVGGKAGARPRVVHTFKAGLVLGPNETCRLVTGSSGKRSHGEAPEEEGVRNAHLFLKATYMPRPGVTVRLTNRQVELCKAVFAAEGGAASA